jgi:type IV pilus assembly protein PilB
VPSDTGPRDLTPAEARELRDSADLFEVALAENPADLTALEALREIYTRLGDAARLRQIGVQIARLDADERPEARPPSPPPAAPRSGTPPRTAPPVSYSEDLPPVSPSTRVTLRPSVAGAARGTEAATRASASATKRRPQRARLGELLIAEGIISHDQLHDALREHRRSKERLGSVLARRGLVSEERLVALLSREHGLPSVDVRAYHPAAEVLALVQPHVARKYEVLPLTRTDTALMLAMADPTNVVAMDEIAATTRLTVLPVVAAGAAIRVAVEQFYATASSAVGDELLSELNDAAVEIVSDDDQKAQGDVIELRDAADEPPVVRFVNKVLLDAIRRGASDLHWEPYEKSFRIRFRIDGVMHEMASPSKRVEASVISRLKIMANLDIAERRLPQDGRIKLRHGTREIDFRVSILPTIFGEKAVLRILDKEALQLDLTKLGFDTWSFEKFTHAIHQPYGMVLITGPTGSGKTTTLYSAISTINSPDHNIMTAEDPVEYNLKGVNQVQVNDSIGRTFATVLRSFLRQDPDVILVGETRDLETAQISVRAALTGHLVFTTLHTNDCPSTIARMIDMGIQPFLLSSALLLIVAQRLGRRICGECKEPVEARQEDLARYGHVPDGTNRVTLYRGRGCATCNGTGMKGRIAIYEVMPISEAIRDLILEDASTAVIREQAQKEGMKSLRQAGMAKVLEGVTTVDEVVRVTLA